MEHAKKLLQYSSLPICEIADQCGFGDASYFTKCFVKQIGIGPEKWKETLIKKK
jgi:AraC family transcriptional regulator